MLIRVNPHNTFVDNGHFERYADDAHKVFSGHQGAQDGTDTQCLTFPFVDKLVEGEEMRKEGERRDKAKKIISNPADHIDKRYHAKLQ